MINETIEKYLGESMKIDYVAPDTDVPADAKSLFDKIWKKDKGGVLSGSGRKMYQDLKKMGYWISNTKGKFALNKIDAKGQWLKDANGKSIYRETGKL
jgi:hypothetical protein